LGIVQSVASSFDPGWQILAGHIAFLAVLAVRPYGLFGRET
jgi:branched-chain amino acid transport system permease protein